MSHMDINGILAATVWISGIAMIVGVTELILALLLYVFKVEKWKEDVFFGGLFLLLSIASSAFAVAFLR